MKWLPHILLVLVCFGLPACSKSKAPEVKSPADVDEQVEEDWLKLNAWKATALDEWLAQSEQNNVSFLTREEAARLADVSFQDHSVELLALVDEASPTESRFLVGQIRRLQNRRAYLRALLGAAPEVRLSLEFGHKWVVVSEAQEAAGNVPAR
ncbi:MAG: hypothetical protein KJ070_07315 [Verrucomicrobia bacterium]|nr:hypothetical protein [Verrucomicrobiota bacterium]